MSLWTTDRKDPREGPVVTRRGLVLLGGQLVFGGVLAWRMRDLQVVDAARYRLLAEENRINLELLATARAQRPAALKGMPERPRPTRRPCRRSAPLR